MTPRSTADRVGIPRHPSTLFLCYNISMFRNPIPEGRRRTSTRVGVRELSALRRAVHRELSGHAAARRLRALGAVLIEDARRQEAAGAGAREDGDWSADPGQGRR